MNGAKVFVDTNVLLYWMDMENTPKATRAREWIDACWDFGAGRLSWQVLHEFYWNATKKMKVPADQLQRVLGITDVNYLVSGHSLAVVDSPLGS